MLHFGLNNMNRFGNICIRLRCSYSMFEIAPAFCKGVVDLCFFEAVTSNSPGCSKHIVNGSLVLQKP